MLPWRSYNMTATPVDPRSALDAANASDMVQKKLSVDAMRKRVSGGADEEKKLRDACEGFESVFLQKMWEQMRNNVKKEGYLHSKDEEAYQSMFDTELAKKMASAGGIGLADMLYEQLSQKLTKAGKTTGAGSPRAPLPIEPARARANVAATTAGKAPAPEELYTDMPDAVPAEPEQNPLQEALNDLAASRDQAADMADAARPMFDPQTGAPMSAAAERRKEESGARRGYAFAAIPERVNAPGKARPSNALNGVNRSSRQSRKHAARMRDAETGRVENAPAERMRRTGPDRESAQTGRVEPQADNPAALHAPAPSDAGTYENDWATSGDMVSSYQNQARTLQNSGRALWSRTA